MAGGGLPLDLGELAEQVCIPDLKWLTCSDLGELADFCRHQMDVSIKRTRQRGQARHFLKGSVQI